MHKGNRGANAKGASRKGADEGDARGDQVSSGSLTAVRRVIKYEGNETTRKYPNTMQEAFPKDPANAEWWFPPQHYWSAKNVALAGIGIILWISLTYFFVKNP